MTVSVLCLFLTVPWVGLQCVIIAFLDQTHFLVPWIGLQSVIVVIPGHTHFLKALGQIFFIS